MFTLKLNEIELIPRIEEDKSFSNEDRYELQSEVITYIQEKYANAYKNPVTVSRKVSEATRDKKGETFDNQMERENSESAAEFDASEKKRDEVSEKVINKYAPEFEQISVEMGKKIDALRGEYQLKIVALINEGKKDEAKALEEERSIKDDDISYEYKQKYQELVDKQFAEMQQKINAT